MELLQVSGISRKEEGAYVVKDSSFTQKSLQRIAIAGATGSGKTTLLKLIAGLAQPDSGQVLFNGERVLGPDEQLIPGHPGIAYLSQHFQLRNNYRVIELLEMANQLTEAEAELVYRVCKIDHLLKRWTHQLSGGERQRIALACLLVTAPKLLLLDEPYSNLDVLHKNILKSVLQDISEQLEMTCLLVSHDPVDVLSWADIILVLQEGQIVQKGAPEYVYRHPVNEYTAALFGKYTLLESGLVRTLSAFKKGTQAVPRFIRPEQFRLSADAAKGVAGEVQRSWFMGGFYELEVKVAGHLLIVTSAEDYSVGSTVYVSLM